MQLADKELLWDKDIQAFMETDKNLAIIQLDGKFEFVEKVLDKLSSVQKQIEKIEIADVEINNRKEQGSR